MAALESARLTPDSVPAARLDARLHEMRLGIPTALVACIVLAASACSGSTPKDSGVTEVQFDAATSLDEPVVLRLFEEDLPIVEAEIAGCGTARLLVDSAMEITLLDRTFVESCGLPQRPFAIEFLIDTAGGRLQRLERVAHVERLSLGSASANSTNG